MERAFLENIKVGDQALPASIIDTIMQEHSRGIENATRAENVGNNGSKTFTQEEVNRIVSERLERERAKGKPTPTPEDERETALKARESAMDCRDYVQENNYPKKLLEMLDTSDFEKFKADIEKGLEFVSLFKPTPPPYAAGTGTQSLGNYGRDDRIADAFKPNY